MSHPRLSPIQNALYPRPLQYLTEFGGAVGDGDMGDMAISAGMHVVTLEPTASSGEAGRPWACTAGQGGRTATVRADKTTFAVPADRTAFSVPKERR